MTDEEVNKTIECYVGYSDAFNPCDTPYEKNTQITRYTESLDALVPVWEKMKVRMTHSGTGFNSLGKIGLSFVVRPDSMKHGAISVKSTIHQAAAHATAKAIKELI